MITGSAVVLSFHSDVTVQYRGFDLHFSFFPLGELDINTLTTKCSVVKLSKVKCSVV